MKAQGGRPLPATITSALAGGQDAQARINVRVAALAEELRAIHGGEWLVIMDHEKLAVILYAER